MSRNLTPSETYPSQLARVRLMAQGHGPMLSGEEREALGVVVAHLDYREQLRNALCDLMDRVICCPECDGDGSVRGRKCQDCGGCGEVFRPGPDLDTLRALLAPAAEQEAQSDNS